MRRWRWWWRRCGGGGVDLRHVLLLEEEAGHLLLARHAQVHVHAPLRVAVRQCGAAAWPLQQEASVLQRAEVDGRQWLVGVCAHERRAAVVLVREAGEWACVREGAAAYSSQASLVAVLFSARSPALVGERESDARTECSQRSRAGNVDVPLWRLHANLDFAPGADGQSRGNKPDTALGMESIEALITQVAKKRKLDPTVKGLDSLISALRRWQGEAEAGSSGKDALSAQVSAQGLEELVHGHHKAVNAAVTKLGKGIDKTMASLVELPLERMPNALVAQAVQQRRLQPS